MTWGIQWWSTKDKTTGWVIDKDGKRKEFATYGEAIAYTNTIWRYDDSSIAYSPNQLEVGLRLRDATEQIAPKYLEDPLDDRQVCA